MLIVSLLPCLLSLSQDTVVVVEKSIKVAAMSSMTEYYGFAEGDKVVFNFWVEKGKELKDIIISEYPNSVKYAGHTVERIDNKVLEISRKSVYKLEYANSAILPRVLTIRIQRIPRSAVTRNFNTNIKWVDRVDTTYQSHQTGYHLKADTSFKEVLNTIVQVNSKSSADNTHRKLVDFTLPAGTIRWTYWIGVGDKALQLYEQDQKSMHALDVKPPTTEPLAYVALGLAPMTQLKVGENIRYFFISKMEETQKFMNGAGFGQFRQGDMVADFGLMNYSNKNDQKYYIGLSNDNPSQALQVHIKILAMVVMKDYETKGESVPILNSLRVPMHEN